MLIYMLVGNSLEIGCMTKTRFLGGDLEKISKKNYRLFQGKSGFPVYIRAVSGTYRGKMESICHLFTFRPYIRLICGGYASNMRAL